MQTTTTKQTAVRLVLLLLALILVAWPSMLSTPFSLTSITISVLLIWLTLIVVLVILAR
ncbi:hypothetical protein [Vibrio brasiliensis]|uniref:Uncharacterized protein n=1 Tax=Vibrio brasiliensis LMG 20546 TaxID=945543 RepID=E8LP42_9VIBR|nr:hypothetical protein [Vibrio brasiliensis]EGA67504.1 hypothetical protein VIBR0546_12737 [Vibrio brasiliensis LMG 20546]